MNALLKSGLALAVKEFLDKIDSIKIKIHLSQLVYILTLNGVI